MCFKIFLGFFKTLNITLKIFSSLHFALLAMFVYIYQEAKISVIQSSYDKNISELYDRHDTIYEGVRNLCETRDGHDETLRNLRADLKLCRRSNAFAQFNEDDIRRVITIRNKRYRILDEKEGFDRVLTYRNED